jgi:hypothetical protein
MSFYINTILFILCFIGYGGGGGYDDRRGGGGGYDNRY